MKSTARQIPESFAKVFGFFIVALVIASGSCRFNRPQAQTTYPTKWCNRAYYEEYYGADWHLYWAAHFCWLYTENATPTRPVDSRIRLAVRGR